MSDEPRAIVTRRRSRRGRGRVEEESSARRGRRRDGIGAIAAQACQALISLVIQVLVIRLLGMDDYGRFAILYGALIAATAVISGLVGDSLIVLDRRSRPIRAGLQLVALGSVLLAGVACGLVAWACRLVDGWTALAVAAAVVAFAGQELARRVLMANVRFWYVSVIDVSGFLIAAATLAGVATLGTLSLASFFAAIAIGQVGSILVAGKCIPRDDRWMSRYRPAACGAVLRYGAWRGAQQLLRPATLTAVRTAVMVIAGLASVGQIEAARTLTSPLPLLVGGMASFLFVKFAAGASLREADRAVGYLVAVTVVAGSVGVVVLPVIGTVLFGTGIGTALIVGWLVYGVSIAMVTPYGSLAAVTGRQRGVFGIRVADSVLSLALVVLVLRIGLPLVSVPLALAVGSIIGGIALRVMLARAVSRRGGSDEAPGVPAFAATTESEGRLP